jgi:LPXTG-site transpeptidase (sortase) family protein
VQRFRLLLRLRPRLSSVLIGAGLGTLLVGGFVIGVPWYASEQWRNSPEAVRAQRNADVPPPIWLTPTPADPAAARSAATAVRPARPAVQRVNPTTTTTTAGAAPPAATSQPAGLGDAAPPTAAPEPVEPAAITPTPAVSPLQLMATEFQFLDPPEPGASARLNVTVHNPTDTPSGPVSLVLPLDWLAGYRIETLDPPPLDGTQNGGRADGSLTLRFDGPDAQSDVDLAIDVVATDEVIDAPMLQVLDADGAEVGRVRPPTEAPAARPGPIYAIDIPNLHLHAGVVPVDWEPPLFVVGQLRASAFVTQGNSVLVGHLRGAAGYNVFDHLDQLAPGDKVIASSRGETYDFVVSQMQVLPEDDTSLTASSSAPRLTLMTCAGTWNPLTRDYSDRLWVIAEPVDAAAGQDTAADTRPTPAANPASAAARPTQISPRGGLGNTDADLAAAFGRPVGESATGLAVYHAGAASNNLEHRAQLADVPGEPARRAVLVADVPPLSAPLTFDAAVALSRTLLPNDVQPRAHGPEGNPRYIVERFTSPALAATLPAQWLDPKAQLGQPGDLLVVYGRRPDGRIAFVEVGLGDDAEALLARLSDIRGLAP